MLSNVGFILNKTHLVTDHVAHPVHVVVLVVVVDLPVLAGDGVQVGVVDGEGGVVLLQDVGRCPLDAQFAQGECSTLSIRTSDHLDQVLGP